MISQFQKESKQQNYIKKGYWRYVIHKGLREMQEFEGRRPIFPRSAYWVAGSHLHTLATLCPILQGSQEFKESFLILGESILESGP